MTDTVTVFRIEAVTSGKGPYCNDNYEIPPCPASHRSLEHSPTPGNDGIPTDLINREIHFFGFISIRAMARWFIRLNEIQRSKDWNIVSYTVPREHVIEGRSQVVFARHMAVAKEVIA